MSVLWCLRPHSFTGWYFCCQWRLHPNQMKTNTEIPQKIKVFLFCWRSHRFPHWLSAGNTGNLWQACANVCMRDNQPLGQPLYCCCLLSEPVGPFGGPVNIQYTVAHHVFALFKHMVSAIDAGFKSFMFKYPVSKTPWPKRLVDVSGQRRMGATGRGSKKMGCSSRRAQRVPLLSVPRGPLRGYAPRGVDSQSSRS